MYVCEHFQRYDTHTIAIREDSKESKKKLEENHEI